MEELIDAIIKTYGLVGVVIILPYPITYILWKDNKKKDAEAKKEREAFSKALQDLNQARIDDAAKISERLLDLAREQIEVQKDTNTAIDKLSAMLEVFTRVVGRP